MTVRTEHKRGRVPEYDRGGDTVSADTMIRPEVRGPATDDEDPVYSHILAGPGARARLAAALVNGTPVRAVCGKVWVPHRDPKRYPMCPRCRRIVEAHGLTPPEGESL